MQLISYNKLTMDYIEQIQVKNEPLHLQKHKYWSYIFMALSCFTWVSAFIYCNEHNVNPIQSNIIRGFMIMLFSYAICRWEGISLDMKMNQREIFIRNIIFLAQAYVMAWVQFYLPLGIIHTLTMIGPFFICIFQYIFQNQKPHKREAIGMILTFLGVILTSNGRLITSIIDPSSQFISDFTNYRSKDPFTVTMVSISLIAFYLIWAYGVYTTNKIKASAHFVNTLFGLKLYLFSSALYVLLLENGKNIDRSVFYWGFLWSGLIFAFSQTFFVLAIVLASNVGMTIMVGSVGVVFAYFMGIMRYGEEINYFCLAGSLFIILGLSRIILH